MEFLFLLKKNNGPEYIDKWIAIEFDLIHVHIDSKKYHQGSNTISKGLIKYNKEYVGIIVGLLVFEGLSHGHLAILQTHKKDILF